MFSNETKRDSLLDEMTYVEQKDFFEGEKNSSRSMNIISDIKRDISVRKRAGWARVIRSIEYAILEYSAGVEMLNVLDEVKIIFSELEQQKDLFTDRVLQYWEPDAYQYLLWLYSLAVMTGESHQIVSITRWLAKNNMGDDDPLLSILLARLGIEGLPRQDKLVFPNSYQHLFDAIKGDGVNPTKEERQQSLTLYLKDWYKGMKHCYWYNRHKGRFPTFFGYWAFEAGLVTLLYDLDDSSYRHMLYYPADYVDYARAQGLNKINFTKHHLLFAGDECPCDGVWWANLSNDKVFLKKGERIPAPVQNENEHTYFWINQ